MRRSSPFALVCAATIAPCVVAGIVAATREWYPASDWALLELATADVYTLRPPLVGAYSRLGLNHPGPLEMWLLAPVYVVAGRLPSALLAGAALINTVAILGALRSARRLGGWALVAPTSLVLLTVCSLGLAPGALTDPWNPYVGFLPFVWFGLLCGEMAGGRIEAAPWLVFTGSLVMQCHLSYVPPVLAMTALTIGLTIAARRQWKRTTGKPRRGALFGAAALMVLLWAPPIYQQLTVERGNLGRIWGLAAGNGFGTSTTNSGTLAQGAGLENALGHLGRITLAPNPLDLALPQFDTPLPIPWPWWTGVFVVVGLIVAGLTIRGPTSRRWNQRPSPTTESGVADHRPLFLLAAAGGVGMVGGTAGMSGLTFAWLLRPMWALPMWTLAAIVWAIADSPFIATKATRAHARLRATPGRRNAAFVAAIAATVLACIPALGARTPHDAWTTAVRDLCEPAADQIGAAGWPAVSVSTENNADLAFLGFACMATFARHGIDVRVADGVDDVLVPGHGPSSTDSGQERGIVPRIVVATGDAAVAKERRAAGAVELSSLTVDADQRAAGIPNAVVLRSGIAFG